MANQIRNKKYYKVKTKDGYVLWTLTINGFGINGNVKVEYEFINTPDLADSFSYDEACDVAFELNKKHNAINYALIEDAETV